MSVSAVVVALNDVCSASVLLSSTRYLIKPTRNIQVSRLSGYQIIGLSDYQVIRSSNYLDNYECFFMGIELLL